MTNKKSHYALSIDTKFNNQDRELWMTMNSFGISQDFADLGTKNGKTNKDRPPIVSDGVVAH